MEIEEIIKDMEFLLECYSSSTFSSYCSFKFNNWKYKYSSKILTYDDDDIYWFTSGDDFKKFLNSPIEHLGLYFTINYSAFDEEEFEFYEELFKSNVDENFYNKKIVESLEKFNKKEEENIKKDGFGTPLYINDLNKLLEEINNYLDNGITVLDKINDSPDLKEEYFIHQGYTLDKNKKYYKNQILIFNDLFKRNEVEYIVTSTYCKTFLFFRPKGQSEELYMWKFYSAIHWE